MGRLGFAGSRLWMSLLPLLLAACNSPAPDPQVTIGPERTDVATSPTLPAGNAVEGERVARRVGCTGCHGGNAAGKELWDDPGKYQLFSANLTDVRHRYDDTGFEQLLRQGKTHDGHVPLGMPVFMLQHLSDQEVRDITAWLRALPAVANPALKPSWISEETQKQLADGSFAEDDFLPDPGVTPLASPPSDALALGEHLAMTSCTECHGRELRGWGPDDPAPSLVVAKGYSPANFARLMKTGIAANGKETASGFMSAVARQRFSVLNESEVAALKAYLDVRAP